MKLSTHPDLVPKASSVCSYSSTPTYIFIACCSVEQRILLYGVVISYVQGQRYLYFYELLLKVYKPNYISGTLCM